ncbi:t-complex protein 1 subunit eta [Anaeramoeba ignava]|uniref:T-complex protein 1 subunit eta n=1 Tax=Anaeramoeba ignava TaxID=1746090 RepID=A0A9Q0RDT4_ANAIG|nr:t-complex protein 1 subunit eta [Anaeramoeba ignava]
MSNFLQPTILLLKDGTDTAQGKQHLIGNINACSFVVDTIRTTLGPRGMDKLINTGRYSTVSNDGATILDLLDIVHPAARTLVDIAKSQDAEVGDGTTTVVILAYELLKQAKKYIEDDVHPKIIIKSYRQAAQLCLKRIDEIAVKIDTTDKDKSLEMLEKCAGTALNSKLIASYKEFFSKIVVKAVTNLDQELLDLDLIGIKKVSGGAMQDSLFIDGVAFKKTFSYAGFEQQPKKFIKPKIALLNVELELKSEKTGAEVRIEDPQEYQSIIDAEWDIIYKKLDTIVKAGANVVLSRLAIGDLATQYFADRDVFCAGRVPEEDLNRLSKATGKQIQSTVSKLTHEMLGECDLMEEKQMGKERYNILSGFPHKSTSTIILRGGAEQFLNEMERSLHDSIMIVKRAIKNNTIVAGGGAIEMELSRYLIEHAKKIFGKEQILIEAFAKALEITPKQLAENAGFDAMAILNKLRKEHADPNPDKMWIGVDIDNEDVCDTFKTFVWEPSLIKRNAINAATEAACLILSVDQTVKNPNSSEEQNKQIQQQKQMLRPTRGARF